MNLRFRGQSQSAQAAPPGELAAYNARIAQLQDQAFTLACDLLREERLAVEVLQEVFVNGFSSRAANHPGFGHEILHQVLQTCLKRKSVLPGPDMPEFIHSGLSNYELATLVLVDHLELSYVDAAEVIGVTPLNIRKTLAEARFILNSSLFSD